MFTGSLIPVKEGEALLALPDEPTAYTAGVNIPTSAYGLPDENEHNVKLKSPRLRFDMFAIMERTSPSIEVAVSHNRGIVASVKLDVTDGQHADELREAIGLVDGRRGLPTQPVGEVIAEMSRALMDGLYVGAPIWEQSDEGMYYPDRVDIRGNRTLETAVHDETGRLIGFNQAVAGSMSAYRTFIPISHVVYATDRSGVGPFGQGAKRVMYGDYLSIVECDRQIRGGVRKGTFRTPLLTFDKDAVPRRAAGGSTDKGFQSPLASPEAFKASAGEQGAIAAGIVSNVRAWAAFGPGWSVEPYGDPFNPDAPLAVKRAAHRAILEVVHAGHMNTGAEGTGGTYNASSELQRVSEVITAMGVNRLIQAYNRGVVDPWYHYRYPDLPIRERAYLTYSGLDRAHLATLVDAIDRIGDRLHLDADDVDGIRAQFGMAPSKAPMRTAIEARALAGAATRRTAGELASLRRTNS